MELQVQGILTQTEIPQVQGFTVHSAGIPQEVALTCASMTDHHCPFIARAFELYDDIQA